MIKIFTIGFTGKPASRFFDLLENNGVTKIVDTRISNSSQLAGFAKGSDLQYFAKRISNVSYEHDLDLAPTKELLDSYRGKKITWGEYTVRYLDLIQSRHITDYIKIEDYNNACLLCSEHTADKCHRRLLAEFLQSHYPDVEIVHLK